MRKDKVYVIGGVVDKRVTKVMQLARLNIKAPFTLGF